MVSASTAGGLNNPKGAALSSLKKGPALFFKEDKEAPFAVAGNGAKGFAGRRDCLQYLWLKRTTGHARFYF